MEMAKNILAINVGSASKKYTLFEGTEEIFSAHFEKVSSGFGVSLRNMGKEIPRRAIQEKEFKDSAKIFLDLIKKEIPAQSQNISVMVFRIVHGGGVFYNPTVLTNEVLRQLDDVQELAPLHMKPALEEVRRMRVLLPGDVLQVAIFDSAFHHLLPPKSRYYAIPFEMAEKLKVRRYGFHGISCASIVRLLKDREGKMPSKLIVCHLGGGASITAIRDGQSVDTSMGFTPLEGLPMSTRPGDIDAGAVLYLEKKLGLSSDAMDEFLNTSCGFLGLSQETADVRELLHKERAGDARAALALELFVYRVQKYIAGFIVTLGGLDEIIFTAAIGEGSALLRQRICEGLVPFGVRLDERVNNVLIDKEGVVSMKTSQVKVTVLKTREMEEMARQVLEMETDK